MSAAPQPQPNIRQAIYERDGYRCVDCGAVGKPGSKPGDLNVHHVVSRRLGGTNDPDNMVTLCIACHKKRDLPALREAAKRRKPDPRQAIWKAAYKRYNLSCGVYGAASVQSARAKAVCDRVRWWREPGDADRR